jgi:Fe-S cluster assembly ATPase SufC
MEAISMWASKIELNKDDMLKYKIDNNKTYFDTSLGFLKCHKGIRPNKMHLLLAPTHAGKSTLARTIITDFIYKNKDKKVLLILSEETKQDFESELSNAVDADDIISNIHVYSELSWLDESPEEMMNFITGFIELKGISLLFFDNLTTSRMYNDRSVKEQSQVSSWLKQITNKVAVFAIAHTLGSDFNNRLLDENDIRGSKTITNLTEFLYILQPIYVGDRIYQFINIKKHRSQEVKNKFFILTYSHDLKIFNQAQAISFDDIASVFRQRNQLTKVK